MKSSDKRRMELQEFQEFVDVEVHRMLHPAQTRWLSLREVVQRMLEQWDALRLFFTQKWMEERLVTAELIFQGLHDPFMKMYCNFLDWVIPKFANANQLFQSKGVVVFNVHEKMSDLLRDLLKAYMMRDYVARTLLAAVNPRDERHFLSLSQMYLGAGVMVALQTPDIMTRPDRIEEFRKRCRNFLITGCAAIQARYDFKSEIMSTLLPLFAPGWASSAAGRTQVPSLIPYLHLVSRLAPADPHKLDDEWRACRGSWTELQSSRRRWRQLLGEGSRMRAGGASRIRLECTVSPSRKRRLRARVCHHV
ncbi:hypothetical protein O181_084733 [Austropuccinia psidii MF-1]|uniref:Uncharacterized protein n=1 Tax=Austropuccinia psidii MF-1 TaxID=1389203 RepID=A0A9Q3IKY0_9BASI|nr:hypothetical protein [Austropuccinia psidii MF-1]